MYAGMNQVLSIILSAMLTNTFHYSDTAFSIRHYIECKMHDETKMQTTVHLYADNLGIRMQYAFKMRYIL